MKIVRFTDKDKNYADQAFAIRRKVFVEEQHVDPLLEYEKEEESTHYLVFVDDIADMAQVIVDNAQGGDVVLCMGAGSIGAVSGQVVDMLQNSEHLTQEILDL